MAHGIEQGIKTHGSAAGHSRQNRHGVAIGDIAVDAVQETDILIIEVDIDEATKAGFVHQPLADSRIRRVEVGDQLL